MNNPVLDALLAVQLDDSAIRAIESRRAELAPRAAHLEATYKRAVADVARSEAAYEKEIAEQRALESALADLRVRHEHNSDLLNHAQKLRDATAAAKQLEDSRVALAGLESRALSVSRRVSDLKTAVTAHREVLASLTAEQKDARAAIAGELAAIDAELAAARKKRNEAAARVDRSLLSKYERISSRRQSDALIELRHFNCSACDTAIPLQRRPAMSSGMHIEPCEGCGVLLYHRPGEGSDARSADAG